MNTFSVFQFAFTLSLTVVHSSLRYTLFIFRSVFMRRAATKAELSRRALWSKQTLNSAEDSALQIFCEAEVKFNEMPADLCFV